MSAIVENKRTTATGGISSRAAARASLRGRGSDIQETTHDVQHSVSPAHRHPLSRWYVCPLATTVAGRLSATRVRPNHVTLVGLGFASVAAVLVAGSATGGASVLGSSALGSGAMLAAAAFVWLAWFCDRLDGLLARRQGTASPVGARLDALTDEFTDVLWHAALAAALAASYKAAWPWWLAVGFVAGKYLMFRGQQSTETGRPTTRSASLRSADHASAGAGNRTTAVQRHGRDRLRRLARLPGDADVRLHMLLIALLLSPWMSWLVAVELAFVAIYYNVRWPAHFLLHARGEGGGR
jgi:phosphatidylglycerophosphate synthase